MARVGKTTQAERFVQYCKDFGAITRYQAMMDLGIASVTSVIAQLRRAGVNVVADIQHTTNRYGEKVRYAIWHIEEDVEEK